MPRDLLALRNAAQDTSYPSNSNSNVDPRRSDEFQRGQPARRRSRGAGDGSPSVASDAQYRLGAPPMQARPSQERSRGYSANDPSARRPQYASNASTPSQSQMSLAQMRTNPSSTGTRSPMSGRFPQAQSGSVGAAPPSPRDFVPGFANQQTVPADNRHESIMSYYQTPNAPSNSRGLMAPSLSMQGDVSPRSASPAYLGNAPSPRDTRRPTLQAIPLARPSGVASTTTRPQRHQSIAPASKLAPPPSMRRDPSDDDQYSEKGSPIDDYYYGTEAAEPRQDVSNGKLRKKGGAGRSTVRKGEVPFENMSQFFGEVSDLQSALREVDSQISHIQSLHLRLLDVANSDDASAQALKASLTESTQSTRSFMNSVKERVRSLEQGNANLRAMVPLGQSVENLTLADVNVRATQVGALKERFKEAIQRYGEVERDARAKNRARLERQVKIVNPGLSKDEVTGLVREAEDGGDVAVFSQALTQQGARSFAARGALREVESRAAALARIETTLVELAQMFNDMATLVEAQDVQIVDIETKATQANMDMEQGLEQTKKAVVSARGARKKAWICFGITMVIIIIVVLVLLFKLILPLINKNKSNNNANNQNPSTSSTARPVTSSAAVLVAPTTLSTIVDSVAPTAAITAAPTWSAYGLPTYGNSTDTETDGSYDSSSTDTGTDGSGDPTDSYDESSSTTSSRRSRATTSSSGDSRRRR